MSSEAVTMARHGGVALLTLNVPERRNVLSGAVVDAVGAHLEALEKDPTVRCLVLTGAGSAFCAGAELGTLRAAANGDFDSVEHVYLGFLRVLRSPLPTIAAINGPAVGAGFNLALACDVRLAARRAVFDTRFAQLRLHPGGGHTWLLARAVGQQQAIMANLFGEIWDAEKAKSVGLVADVYDDDKLVAAAIALGQRLDVQEGEYTRELVATLRTALTTHRHEDSLAHETKVQRWSSTRPAFKEGVAAIEARVARAKT